MSRGLPHCVERGDQKDKKQGNAKNTKVAKIAKETEIMVLPEHLEGLKDISIDTLGLSESTQAVLKFYGVIDVLDCIAFFYRTAQERNAGTPWSRLFTLMFTEVKPALIAAGYWDLVLDAEVWRILGEQNYESSPLMVVRWQGRDTDLYAIPIDQLALLPREGAMFDNVGSCIHYFIHIAPKDSQYGLEMDKASAANRSLNLYEYMFAVVQPRFVEIGLWAFVEEHVDDFDAEEVRWFDWDEGWETFDVDDPPIHMVLLRFLIAPITIVAEGLPLLVQTARAWLDSHKR